MKQLIQCISVSLLLFCLSSRVSAQITLVKNGKATSRIVLVDYSFINGEHRPGHNSQWCLTNPKVFDAAVRQLDSIFKAHPDMKMISVSQNDGNNTNCSCSACKEVDEYEGSPSGNLIRFLNKLAKRFPDKEFSTLAYLYSMQPPKHVKPLPNFHILQKNIQLFKKNHVTMHFSQVNGIRGGDFSEMRAYMIGKLMWDPYQNADSLMRTFMNGYYGAAAPYLYQYQKIMQGALLAGVPVSSASRH